MEHQNQQPLSPQPQAFPTQQQQQQFQPMPGPAPTVSSRGWQIAKVVLHSLTAVLSIAVIGMLISIAVHYPSEAVALVWTMPQVGVSLCWAAAELITVCARRRHSHRGIHPGAHVALHLLLWLGLCVAVALNAILFAAWMLYDDYYGYYDYYYYDDDDLDSGYFVVLKALIAFLALLIILHFTLFIRACIETSRRNSASAPPVFMMPVPVSMYPQQYAAPATPQHLSGQFNFDQGKEVFPSQQQQQVDGAAISSPPQSQSQSYIQEDGLHMHPPRYG